MSMSIIWNFPLFTIVLSLFSGVLCMMLKGKAARNYTVCYELFLITLVSCVFGYTYRRGESFTYKMGEFPAPWGNEIRAGILEAFLALAFLLILLCSVLAGWHFLRKDIESSKINLYFSLINLLTAALMAMTWTNDVFTGYVFLEILTLTSCGILIVREIGRTTLAAVRYMVMNLIGSGLFLLGIVLLYDFSGHLLMVPMRETFARIVAENPEKLPYLSLSIIILTIGLGIKSGLFPFHFWMPDTYGSATPTSASILSSLVSKAYIFLLFKIYYRSIGMDVILQTPILKILFILGICGMIFGSVSAIRAHDINRMIAFSSAAQIGYIYMGLGLGTMAGMAAALFQIFAHAFTKSLLFLTTPYLAETNGDSLLFHNLQGSGRRNVAAGLFFTVGAFSMVGIPIFAGFTSKLNFAQAAVLDTNHVKMIVVFIALAISSLLNALYFLRTVIRLFSRPDEAEPQAAAEEIGATLPAESAAAAAAPAAAGQTAVSSGMGLYILAGSILTAGNLFLGLCSWKAVGLIYRGLMMFE